MMIPFYLSHYGGYTLEYYNEVEMKYIRLQ